jgi:hypothetical protein
MYSGSRKNKNGFSSPNPPSNDPNATKPATPSRIRQWFTAFNNKFWSIFHRKPTSTELGKGAEKGLIIPTEKTVRQAAEDISPKNLETIVPLHTEHDFYQVLSLDKTEKEKLIKELLDEKQSPLQKSYEGTIEEQGLILISQLTKGNTLESLSDEHLNYVLMDLLLLQKKKVGTEHERIQFVQFLRANFPHPKVMVWTYKGISTTSYFASLTGNYLQEDKDVFSYQPQTLFTHLFKDVFDAKNYERDHFIALTEDAKSILDKKYGKQKQTNASEPAVPVAAATSLREFHKPEVLSELTEISKHTALKAVDSPPKVKTLPQKAASPQNATLPQKAASPQKAALPQKAATEEQVIDYTDFEVFRPKSSSQGLPVDDKKMKEEYEKLLKLMFEPAEKKRELVFESTKQEKLQEIYDLNGQKDRLNFLFELNKSLQNKHFILSNDDLSYILLDIALLKLGNRPTLILQKLKEFNYPKKTMFFCDEDGTVIFCDTILGPSVFMEKSFQASVHELPNIESFLEKFKDSKSDEFLPLNVKALQEKQIVENFRDPFLK